MANVSIEVTDNGPSCKKIAIEVPQEVIQQKIVESFDSLQRSATLPGFRKGRVPRRLLEKNYTESVHGEVLQQLVQENYQKALEDNKLDALTQPQLEGDDKLDLPESGSLSFAFVVEVTPEIDLPDFSALTLTKKSFEVVDENIAEEIESLKERHAKPTLPEDSIKVGDFVGGPVKVTADGEEVLSQPMAYTSVNGEDKEYKGHVLGLVIDNLGKELLGKNKGDTLTVTTTGPDKHENENVRNKELTVEISIDTIHRMEPAPVDEVAKAMGLESEDELKERVRTVLEQRAEAEQKTDLHQQALDSLISQIDVPLPEQVAGTQVKRTLDNKRMELLYKGENQETIEEKLDEIRNESDAEAKKQLKQFFILDKASRELEVEVEDQEIQFFIYNMAMQRGQEPEKLLKEMKKNMGIEQVYLQIREGKTLDKIIEKATVNETK